MTVDPELWKLAQWLIAFAVAGFVGYVVVELRGVRNYASMRYHELANKVQAVLKETITRDEFSDAMKEIRTKLDRITERLPGDRHK